MKTSIIKNRLLIILLLIGTSSLAQKIKPKRGYTPQIGILVDMLENIKKETTKRIKNATDNQTDFLLDEQANRIGALIMHLAAIESVYQVLSFEGRDFNDNES